ncbi:putative cytochrome p450 family protein [Phaeomoniella chlamydospora]|uniref:Putative cytochrome p450 family protein n=1 Tax=Phaeomoniella chlamydospora TaxID=158046 RepID=A0A0G2G3H0_PHACM|nr:putative cytochrome p450 family protein [Phaeomoniella chlamydospora]
MRRGPINPFFSKKRVVAFEHHIQEKVQSLKDKISEYAGTDRVLPLHRAYTALIGDVVTEYCFAKSYGHLKSPDFTETFHEAMHSTCRSSTFLHQFPFLWPILKVLPDWFVVMIEPSFLIHINVQRDFRKEITALKEGKNSSRKTADHPTLFYEMLNAPDLPPGEKSIDRLEEEAQVIIGAAILTTSWSAAVASFHITNNPEVYHKLHTELVSAIPDPFQAIRWSQVENLPYLSAVIKEGIRLAYGIASRLPRVARNDLKYQNWIIPAGVPISMTILDINHSEDVFPDSYKFLPERWISTDPTFSPKAPNGLPLEKYFVGFSKGSRNCIGQKYVLPFPLLFLFPSSSPNHR